MSKKAILLINGEIDIQFCSEYINDNLYELPIYCADGAFNHIQNITTLLVKVKMIIGDGDSICNAQRFNVPYQKDSSQYSTDFDKALHWLKKYGYHELFVFGLGGKEMDHYLGNVSTFLKYQHQLKCIAIDRYGVSQLMRKKMKINHAKGKMISIVPLFELIDLTLKGFAFNLDKYTLRFDEELAIRNHAVEDSLYIDYLRGSGLMFLSHDLYHHSCAM